LAQGLGGGECGGIPDGAKFYKRDITGDTRGGARKKGTQLNVAGLSSFSKTDTRGSRQDKEIPGSTVGGKNA